MYIPGFKKYSYSLQSQFELNNSIQNAVYGTNNVGNWPRNVNFGSGAKFEITTNVNTTFNSPMSSLALFQFLENELKNNTKDAKAQEYKMNPKNNISILKCPSPASLSLNIINGIIQSSETPIVKTKNVIIQDA